MGKVTTNDDQVLEFRRDFQRELRGRIREAIQAVLGKELNAALGCQRHERSEGRRGYRNGTQEPEITTANGLQTLEIPRGRLWTKDEGTTEFQSEILPRYARRTREVDEAILGVYLAGGNSRRIRKALGATRLDILLHFLVEAVVLCLVGGVLGVALGAGGAFALSRLAGWNTYLSPLSIALAFTFSACVGVCFGLWPARRAASLNPIDALRYE